MARSGPLSDDFESKFQFHPLKDLPPPKEFFPFPRIYPSKMNRGNKTHTQLGAFLMNIQIAQASLRERGVDEGNHVFLHIWILVHRWVVSLKWPMNLYVTCDNMYDFNLSLWTVTPNTPAIRTHLRWIACGAFHTSSVLHLTGSTSSGQTKGLQAWLQNQRAPDPSRQMGDDALLLYQSDHHTSGTSMTSGE